MFLKDRTNEMMDVLLRTYADGFDLCIECIKRATKQFEENQIVPINVFSQVLIDLLEQYKKDLSAEIIGEKKWVKKDA